MNEQIIETEVRSQAPGALLLRKTSESRCERRRIDCYFPLFEYSIDYFYINIWRVYKFMEFLQYIFLKPLSSLDRDYFFLILLP